MEPEAENDPISECAFPQRMFDVPRAAVTAGILLFIWIIPVNGQQNSFAVRVQQAYGLDQDLVNGIQYHNEHLQALGHPYFLDDSFAKGSVIIKGREFSGIRVKYDIYSQHLEVEYKTFSEVSQHLVTVTDHVNGFMHGDFKFTKLVLDDELKFYQVIETEKFSCYIHWKKQLIQISTNPHYTEQFTKAVRSYQIHMNGESLSFKSRKTFAGNFPGPLQKKIRSLMRQNQFSFRKAAPDEIIRTMHSVSNLLKSELSP
jgi:hypothetical protein